MLFFKPNTNSDTLRLSTSFYGREQSIAYGPGSVINGSVFIKLQQPMQVHKLNVVFQGQVIQEQQPPMDLFRVEETIPLNEQTNAVSSDNNTMVIAAGSHFYLFAIQLPQVNYPPSITESTFTTFGGTQIRYSLQAFIDYPDHRPALTSNETPILYLPLVVQTKETTAQNDAKEYCTMGDPTTILMKAILTRSSYCPGDQCIIQLITDNNTNTNINQVYVTFITQCSTDQQQHTLTHQAIPVSIPKQTTNHMSQLPLSITQSCLPTFEYNQHGIQIHVTHHIVLGLTPTYQQPTKDAPSRFFSIGSLYGNSVLSTIEPIQLPITIVTLLQQQTPPTIIEHRSSPYFIPAKHTDHQEHSDEETVDLDRQYSVSPSNSFHLEQEAPRQSHLASIAPSASS